MRVVLPLVLAFACGCSDKPGFDVVPCTDGGASVDIGSIDLEDIDGLCAIGKTQPGAVTLPDITFAGSVATVQCPAGVFNVTFDFNCR